MKMGFQKLFGKNELTGGALEEFSRGDLIQLMLKLYAEYKSSQGEIEEKHTENAGLNKELARVREELRLYKEMSDELSGIIQQDKDELQEQKTLADTWSGEAESLRTRLVQAEGELRRDREELEKLRKSRENAETLQGELRALQRKFEEKQGKYRLLVRENKEFKENTGELEADVRGKRIRIDGLEEKLRGTEIEFTGLLKTIKTLERDVELKEQLLNKHEDSLLKNEAARAIQLEEALAEKVLELNELREDLLNSENTVHKLSINMSENEQALGKLRDSFELSQRKREAARQEVLLLSEKLQQTTQDPRALYAAPPPAPHLNFRELPQSESENRAFQVLKARVNGVYNTLMSLLMDAKTLRSQDNTIYYQMAVARFSVFEKEFNELMARISEAAENPNLINSTEGWTAKLSNLVKIQPSKLFSCMLKKERAQGDMISRPIDRSSTFQ